MTDDEHHAEDDHHGRHELPDGVPARLPRTRSQLMFGALAVLLCVLLGVAIATQVRQTESGDALDTARPADLLVLLDSLQQREAALNTEVADLQKTLSALQTSGNNDQAAIENAQARLRAFRAARAAPPGGGGPRSRGPAAARAASKPATVASWVRQARAASSRRFSHASSAATWVAAQLKGGSAVQMVSGK